MKEYDTNMKNNENLKYTIFKPEFICPFLTARDLKHCICVSKKFNQTITAYLEIRTPYLNFGLIDFTKKLEKYQPTIEQISDEEKIITIQNPNFNEKRKIILDINREHFYFPFILEFSEPQLLLITNNDSVGPKISLSDGVLDAYNRGDLDVSSTINRKNVYMGTFKKIFFSPSTNTMFIHSLGFPFNSVSTIQFQIKPSQNIENSVVTFKYKIEKKKSINSLHLKNNVFAFVVLFIFFLIVYYFIKVYCYVHTALWNF